MAFIAKNLLSDIEVVIIIKGKQHSLPVRGVEIKHRADDFTTMVIESLIDIETLEVFNNAIIENLKGKPKGRT